MENDDGFLQDYLLKSLVPDESQKVDLKESAKKKSRKI